MTGLFALRRESVKDATESTWSVLVTTSTIWPTSRLGRICRPVLEVEEIATVVDRVDQRAGGPEWGD